jgi:hypothetical protein
MKAAELKLYNKVCKGCSLLVLLAFAYYWLITIGMIFFGPTISSLTPRQASFYRTFFRQNWGFFATGKIYNRQMNFIIREKENPSIADTIDLERYLITEKWAYAPFNNYQETLEKILFATMNGIEIQVNKEVTSAKQRFPGKSIEFYIQQASKTVLADSINRQPIANIIAFGKEAMKIKKMDSAGKEYQLCMIKKVIPPVHSRELPVTENSQQIIFISAYKPF